MKKRLLFVYSAVFILFSLFAGLASAVTINFDAMPTAVFEYPEVIFDNGEVIPAVTGYDESGYHFAPLAIPGTGYLPSEKFPPHIHRHGDALRYHGDAGGWYSNQLDGGSFNLLQIELLEVSAITQFISPFQHNILPGDFIFEAVGGTYDGYIQRIAPDTTGVFNFGPEFQGINSYLVYYEGYKGSFPPSDVSFSSVIDNVVVSPVPLPAAV